MGNFHSVMLLKRKLLGHNIFLPFPTGCDSVLPMWTRIVLWRSQSSKKSTGHCRTFWRRASRSFWLAFQQDIHIINKFSILLKPLLLVLWGSNHINNLTNTWKKKKENKGLLTEEVVKVYTHLPRLFQESLN